MLGYRYLDPVIVNRPTQRDDGLPGDTAALRRTIDGCHLCDLAKSRRQAMHGHGQTDAAVMVIDAFVSMADDESGHYFSGRSGETLTGMIQNVLNLPVDAVYLTHAVKCKPAGMQKPSESEIESCRAYWLKEIALVRPRVIMTLGPDAYAVVTRDRTPFEQVRGQRITYGDATLVPLYHPQFLLRNPSFKKIALADLQSIKALL